ncbi:FHA domain containing protein [Patulibacter medicamentivorans]|uniref:FHA domain containing protein n=1 Tax=Patulibacter medicamentivorans TaxID=1097667 RepID=H0EBF1_9ACTN|nr:FHA domain-containing protein [Patulibacter medicamentivorans]EHN09027.1 FHA domain containing protein [Patulibacter medicamentivorans]
MAVHCPECGFVAGEGANFCPKCGAYLGDIHAHEEPTTATYRVGDTGEVAAVDLAQVRESGGAALVVRAGGGREGESFPLAGERVTIGRRPESDLFLDDVTVSRDHAIVVSRHDGWHIDDLGSLNGTYVNRRRIDSSLLSDGDEVQVGKYKLTFLAR